jgi:predicted alpha/beta hydrolase family esterase
MSVYLLHGCPDSEHEENNRDWILWTQTQLVELGIHASAPLMPASWTPNYEVFKKEFEKNEVAEHDILVGHSCGGAFLVRWLGDTKQKVKKLILVAPWKISAGQEEYYGFEIDKTIPERVGEIVMFTSDDEEEDGKESVKIFHGALGGKLIELPKHGHFDRESMGTEEFHELLHEILSNP